jgi:hypothetical protein
MATFRSQTFVAGVQTSRQNINVWFGEYRLCGPASMRASDAHVGVLLVFSDRRIIKEKA